ncbi:unnamed protein product [Alternaria burnsii]|nr:unnamed protein product [Alternaria burnsii]
MATIARRVSRFQIDLDAIKSLISTFVPRHLLRYAHAERRPNCSVALMLRRHTEKAPSVTPFDPSQQSLQTCPTLTSMSAFYVEMAPQFLAGDHLYQGSPCVAMHGLVPLKCS